MITAIILAAGQSTRMGQPKMLLPWGRSTVIQTVVSAFHGAGMSDVLVVTGAERQRVEELVGSSAQTVFNPDFASGEMLGSIQTGLAFKMRESSAAVIALGDQPQILRSTISSLLQAAREANASLVAPSLENHRGHPWLVGREYWDEILVMHPPSTMRDFFNLHKRQIHYVRVDHPSVLADIDTPEDYQKYKP